MTDPPPPRLRTTITEAEREQIEAILGPVGDLGLIRAVRDGRGKAFQRLELLGDSVLDVVLTVHRWVEPGCPTCTSLSGAGAASDRRLASAARASGVGRWLEWEASDQRVADLVETCVAVCRASGGWQQVVALVDGVVHPLGDATGRALMAGVATVSGGRVARQVGSACLELAAAELAAETFPDADEGELSTRRAQLHRAGRIAAVARRGHPTWHGDDESTLSRVEDLVADELAQSGADAAVVRAREFLPLH